MLPCHSTGSDRPWLLPHALPSRLCSQAYADYMGFILTLNEGVRGKKLTCDYKVSEVGGEFGSTRFSLFFLLFFFFLVELAARETKCGCAVLGDAKHQPAVLPAGCRGSPCAFGVGKGASYRRMEAAGGKKMQKGRVLSLLLQSGFSQGCSGTPRWLQPEG